MRLRLLTAVYATRTGSDTAPRVSPPLKTPTDVICALWHEFGDVKRGVQTQKRSRSFLLRLRTSGDPERTRTVDLQRDRLAC